MRMDIKKGDNVQVITGKDKGKSGVVARAIPEMEQVVIDGVNLKKRHVKDRGEGRNKQKGGVVERAHPIHVSNVMILDPKDNKPTRIGKTFDEKKKAWVRVARRSGTAL